MIFPQCKTVGINPGFLRNGYPSTDLIYFATRYVLVFDSPGRCEIYEISSIGDGEFLKCIVAVKKIAGADSTFVYPEPVDLHDRAKIIQKACQLCKGTITTVVFLGDDQYMTFVKEPDPEALTVVDVYDTAPPQPPKLASSLSRLEEAGLFGEMMLAFDYHVTDLRQYEDASRTTIFPCHVPGLDGVFLNCLEEEPQGDIKLVGCNKSRKVFKERFPLKAFEHINTCPLSSARPSKPFIMRCCQPDKVGPKEIAGIPGMVVSWSANPPEVYEAIRQLANEIRLKKIHVSD